MLGDELIQMCLSGYYNIKIVGNMKTIMMMLLLVLVISTAAMLMKAVYTN